MNQSMQLWYQRTKKSEVDLIANSCSRFARGLAVKSFAIVFFVVMGICGLPASGSHKLIYFLGGLIVSVLCYCIRKCQVGLGIVLVASTVYLFKLLDTVGACQFAKISVLLGLPIAVLQTYAMYLLNFSDRIHRLERTKVKQAANIMRIMFFLGIDFPRGLSCSKKICTLLGKTG